MTNKELLQIDIYSRFPYGLKFYYKTSDIILEIGDVTSISGAKLCIDSICKPILFPISCLIKEIQFKGENITPIIELAKIEGYVGETIAKECVLGVLYTFLLELCNPNIELLFIFDSDEKSFSAEERNGLNYQIINSLSLYDWLNSHMIDYRGLIDKGLAISVFDLKTNPYG